MLNCSTLGESVKVLERLNKLDNSYDSGRVAADGFMVSIVGAPNMGKSTLMNYLLRDDESNCYRYCWYDKGLP